MCRGGANFNPDVRPFWPDFKRLSAARFLDSPKPGQYGPRGFLGRREFGCFDIARSGSMADGSRKQDDLNRPDEEAALSARLKRLGDRLKQASLPETGPAPRQSTDMSGFARGFRLSSELVAGVAVGALLGWMLDRWLGISPWGLIVFLLLGFAAGVLNVMRAAGVVRNRTMND
jgi:ATP synthase protein I